MTRPSRAPRLTVAQEDELAGQVWRQSLTGAPNAQIARTLGLSPKTVARLLEARRAELHRQRVETGDAMTDLERYLDEMALVRQRAIQLYNRTMVRLLEEEELERQHNAERARRGQLPPTSMTRALRFHVIALRNANDAIRTMMAATAHRGRVLGLEAAGKKLGESAFDAKRLELMKLLETPVEVTILQALPTPEGWDVPEDDDD